MFTRCTQCQAIHPLTLEQLRVGRGILQCRHCATQFDALTHISDTETLADEHKAPDSGLPWDRSKRAGRIYWSAGAGLCFLSLIVQFIYFEGYGLTQKPGIRSVLTVLCDRIPCHLPAYKNPDELNLIGSFSPTAEHYYKLHAAISNEAAFSQAYPNIRLTLLNYNGEPFAARIFQPQDYLPETLRATSLEPDATTEVSLKIAAPKSAVGGSSFELLY